MYGVIYSYDVVYFAILNILSNALLRKRTVLTQRRLVVRSISAQPFAPLYHED